MLELDPLVLRRMLALRQFRIFASAELAELAVLAENVSEARFAEGAAIAEVGSRLPAMHLVVDGAIGSPTRGAAWGPRQMFGVLEVLARRELAAPAYATAPTRTLQLFASDVTEVLDENFTVLRATLQDLAARMISPRLRQRVTVTPPRGATLGFVDRLYILRQLTPFAGVRLEALATLAHACEDVTFAEGSILAHAGEQANASYVIIEGELRATHVGGDVVTLGPGEVVAPFETLAEVEHRSTLEATKRLHALRSSSAAIFDVIEDHTELGLAMIQAFAGQLLESEELARSAATLRGMKTLRA